MSDDKSLLQSLLEAVRDWQSVAKAKWLYRLGHSTDLWDRLEPESLGGPRWLVKAHDGNEDLIRCGMVSEQDLREKQTQRKEAVEKSRKALGILDAEGERGEALLESLDVDSSPLSDFLRHEKHGSATVALAIAAERAIRKALARSNAGKDTSRAGQPEGAVAGHDPAKGQQAEGIDEKTRQQKIAKLPRRVRRAYWSFEAARLMAESKELKDWEAYKLLKEEGIPEDRQGELTDYQLPAKDAWSRYLRIARRALGGQKNTPRRGRQHGRSIVRRDQIEMPVNDDE
jgi:hypothetical protein